MSLTNIYMWMSLTMLSKVAMVFEIFPSCATTSVNVSKWLFVLADI